MTSTTDKLSMEELDEFQAWAEGFAAHEHTAIAAGDILSLVAAARGQWQPIESAPKDGTPVLAYFDAKQQTPFVECIRWRKSGWMTTWNDDVVPRPTHWMPLPAPPSEASPAQGEYWQECEICGRRVHDGEGHDELCPDYPRPVRQPQEERWTDQISAHPAQSSEMLALVGHKAMEDDMSTLTKREREICAEAINFILAGEIDDATWSKSDVRIMERAASKLISPARQPHKEVHSRIEHWRSSVEGLQAEIAKLKEQVRELEAENRKYRYMEIHRAALEQSKP